MEIQNAKIEDASLGFEGHGFTLYHMEECAIMQHFHKHPQMENLGIHPQPLAQSD